MGEEWIGMVIGQTDERNVREGLEGDKGIKGLKKRKNEVEGWNMKQINSHYISKDVLQYFQIKGL